MSLKELAPTYFTRLSKVVREVGKKTRVLNAGCGDGIYDFYLKNKVKEMASIDLNKGDIEIARKLNPERYLMYCIGDIETMPFKSDTFDCVICTDVIEHLTNDMEAISEICRLLKKGGKLIVTTPSKDFPIFYDPLNYILNRFGKKIPIGIWGWGHERLYSIRELESKINLKLTKAGYLSKSLVGLLENSYINSIFQKFTKNDPQNQQQVTNHISRTAKTVKYDAPTILLKIRDIIILLDDLLCSKSRKSIGIMAVFEK